jgi:hypothetical protein
LTSLPSSTPSARPHLERTIPLGWSGQPALLAGLGAWLLVMVVYWPAGLSFGDDVGYLGEAKLMLEGRVLPRFDDVGYWVRTAHGSFPKFPIFVSLLMAPLVAITPRAVFGLGIAAAIALAWIASRILKSWGSNPAWALLLVAHPTVSILSRAAMADVPLSAFALGAWWAMRQHRRAATILLLMALSATKATGFVVGLFLAAGELLRLLPDLRARSREAWSRVGTIAAGLVAGLALIVTTNEISAGGPGFAYDLSFLKTPPFWFTNFPHTAPAQLRTFLLLPPFLILGAIPFWRRREWGPLCLIFGFGAMMCFYFFVDFGTTGLETLILAPRLVLPIVSFLLVGYADLLATLARRFVPSSERSIALALIAVTVAVTWIVDVRHHRWQLPMADALRAAIEATTELHTRQLGMTPEAAKSGVLFPGSTVFVDRDHPTTAVILCSVRSASYRLPTDSTHSCEWPGYREYRRVGDYQVLVRQAPAREVSP